MSYKDQLAETSRFLKGNDPFLVVNHVNPDGDATGSLLAMGFILEALGKSFVLVNEGATPEKFFVVALSEQIKNLTTEPLTQKYRQIIALDCGDLKRVGEVSKFFDEDVALLNIDHHPTNDHFGTVNLIKTDACATAEILFDLVKVLEIPLTQDLATALYMGILTDTGGFRYSNTTAEVMEKAAELLRYGVKPGDVAERCLETISSSYLHLLQQVLPTLALNKEDKVAFLSISVDAREKSAASNEDMEGIVNYARNIEGVEVGVLFKQMDEKTVKVSLRSKREVDVSAIAKVLGGGGHARAAGCTVYDSLDNAQHLLLEKIEELWG